MLKKNQIKIVRIHIQNISFLIFITFWGIKKKKRKTEKFHWNSSIEGRSERGWEKE